MALIKKIVVDQIMVNENGTIFVRQSIRVMENGEQLMQKYRRKTIAPGDDYLNMPDRVRNIAAVVHTLECITTYQAMIAAEEAARSGG